MEQGTTSITIRIKKGVKNEAQHIYSELGIDMTTAINVFLRQSIRSKGFPFAVNMSIPNQVTFDAMRNTQNYIDVHGPFDTVDELMESLNAED